MSAHETSLTEAAVVECHSSTTREDGPARRARTISAQADVTPFSEIIGQSPAMQELRRMIDIAAGVPWPMLLEGESGTGKGIAARAIHDRSRRSCGPFVAVNCAAIPEELVESTLYGYRRGAFTGAVRDQPGKFAEAHRGTLFLDEIGAMSLSAQAKILTTLEDGRITRVGATGFTVCDVRVIAATSANLKEMISAGTFRYDLYYRLNTLAAEIAPLRERREDIPALAQHFTAAATRMLQAPKLMISQEAIKELQRYAWPGNIRELKNAIWRMAAMVQFEGRHEISAADVHLCLPSAAREGGGEVRVSSLPEFLAPGAQETLDEQVARFTLAVIKARLEQCHYNYAATARSLDIDRRTIRRRLQRLERDIARYATARLAIAPQEEASREEEESS